MRKAFSMVTAIFVILILATIAMLSLNMVASTATATTMQYRHEQAQLYARSYTELAIMAITEYDRATNNNCVNNINGYVGDPTKQATEYSLGNGYTVQTVIQYIGGTGVPAGCNKPDAPDVASLGTDNTVASAIIDVSVKYNNPSLSASEIVYHKRTIQKI